MSGRGSDSLETLVSVKGDVLLVRRPGNALCLQEIHDSGDAGEALGCEVHYECHSDTLWWDVVEVIISHSPKVTPDGRSVVGLGRMGQRAILIKTNTLRSEGIEDRLNRRSGQDGINGSNCGYSR